MEDFSMTIDERLNKYELEDLLLLENYTGNFEEDFKIEKSMCNEKNLIVVHNNSKLKSPSYILRFTSFGKEKELTDKGLHVLLDVGSNAAYVELSERHGLDMNKLSDEFFVIGAQKKGNNSDERELLTEKYNNIIGKIIERVDRRYYFRGLEKDDLLQEAYMGFLKAMEVYKVERGTKFRDFSRHVIERHLGTLMNRSTNLRNRALNESFSYNMPVNSSNETTFEELLEGSGILQEELYIKKELYYEIREKLTENELDVLKYYSKGYTYKEIAKILGRNKKSVDNTVQRFRNKAYAHIDEFFKEEEGEEDEMPIEMSEQEGIEEEEFVFSSSKNEKELVSSSSIY